MTMNLLKTIKLGTGPKNADDFKEAIEKAQMTVGVWAYELMGLEDFTVSETLIELDLVAPMVRDFGYKDAGVPREEFFEKVLGEGYRLCPYEVAPQLRIQYPEQPSGEKLLICSKSLVDHEEDEVMFVVENMGGRKVLCADLCYPPVILPPKRRVVLIQPQ